MCAQDGGQVLVLTSGTLVCRSKTVALPTTARPPPGILQHLWKLWCCVPLGFGCPASPPPDPLRSQLGLKAEAGQSASPSMCPPSFPWTKSFPGSQKRLPPGPWPYTVWPQGRSLPREAEGEEEALSGPHDSQAIPEL